MDTPQVSTKIEFSSLFLSHQKTAKALKKGSLEKRKAKLNAIKNWLLEHQSELHQGEYLDLKKPQDEVNVTELYPLVAEAKHAISHLKEWTTPQPIKSSLAFFGTRSFVHYEPKGTALIISPWNYPLLLSLGPLISAIAAGNTVILKPSEFTPATNKVILQMIHELFDQEEVEVIEGEADVSASLLELPFDHIFFTGSPQVGKVVMTAAAKHLSSVTLELGGKSPTIIDETANLNDAAAKLSWAKWTNAGQTCVAPDYLFVHKSKKESFLKLYREATQKMYGQKENYTSIVNVKHYQRLDQTLKDAIEKGANVLISGDNSPENLDIQPVVIENVTEEMRVMKEEIFGPILPIMTYQNLDEVIDFINARPKPLALYLYSKSKRNKKRLLAETSSGALVFNDSVLHFGHPHLPAGGVNNSGLGKAHGHAGFLAFSHDKSIMSQQIGLTVASTVRPPYSRLKKKLIQFMLKYL
ncbi:MAG: aldehyde dehydrogenase family protein [Flammeovirgaceae bacterium]|nr:aldehyde dehydrogenase family protein [Flammeovirgaceae bacterium]MBE62957.1 aldehyde dehydrogenase family protein [Flammeovirgaceae bacterium]HCX20800.1 aldehyde dehydrogenase family protein [Cytophagales bacterium]|tara:strand:- start:2736 stop:4145 length:1410 start_codon:yes stop_codon:yes gene_type:complete